MAKGKKVTEEMVEEVVEEVVEDAVEEFDKDALDTGWDADLLDSLIDEVDSIGVFGGVYEKRDIADIEEEPLEIIDFEPMAFEDNDGYAVALESATGEQFFVFSNAALTRIINICIDKMGMSPVGLLIEFGKVETIKSTKFNGKKKVSMSKQYRKVSVIGGDK